MAFSPQFLDEIRARVDLGEVVGRHVKLARRGREFVGLSPFQNEKSPSFTVVPEKGFYHCFSSGEHGDVIDFVMKVEGLSFPDAVERLAGLAGVPIPADTPEEQARNKKRQSLYGVVEAATRYFERCLHMPEGKAAATYLRGRGLDDETIARFRLGYAPNSRTAIKGALGREGIDEAALIEAGLLIEIEDTARKPYDRFRGRIMFPITDRRGRAIAFGGRIVADGEPKYLNSPETPLFHKGSVLYGLNQASRAARNANSVIVTEGYMDVIALNRAGIENAVAPLGTALTEEQFALLWRLATEAVLCFDGDRAGQQAAARAAERALPLLKPEFGLRFALLPPGEDPDSLVTSQGREAMTRVLAAAVPLSEALWSIESGGRVPATPEARAALQQRLDKHTANITDTTVRSPWYR
jgi:DNA primase